MKTNRLSEYNERAIVLACMAGAEITLSAPTIEVLLYKWRLKYTDKSGDEVESYYATAHHAAYAFCDYMKIPIPWGN